MNSLDLLQFEFAARLLTALVEGGALTREAAYKVVTETEFFADKLGLGNGLVGQYDALAETFAPKVEG